MRVLIASHGYPPTRMGGAEQRAERTARGLMARGCDVRVLCVERFEPDRTTEPWQDTVQDGIAVRRLQIAPSAHLRDTYDNSQTAAAASALIAEWQPHVLHLFSGYLLSSSVVRVAAAHGIPIVISLTDYWWLCHRINLLQTNGTACDGPTPGGCARCHAEGRRRFRVPAKLSARGAEHLWSLAHTKGLFASTLGFDEQEHRAQTMRAALAQATLLIAPSQYLADAYLRFGVDPERIRVQRQGVAGPSPAPRPQADTLRIGYLGQVKYHKGVDLILEAWSRLGSSRPRALALFGADTGEEKYGATIRRRIKRLEHVRWNGPFQEGRVWEVLGTLDVLVVPSRYPENSPNVILEAQAAGIPVVGSSLGGIPELVRHDVNGLLFEPNNPADLATQLQRILDEPELLPRLGRDCARHLSVQEEITRICELYLQAIQAPRAPLEAHGNADRS